MEQRKLIHFECGADNWTPTGEELYEIIKCFQEASVDPVGAAVALRDGIVAHEIMVDDDTVFYAGNRTTTPAILHEVIVQTHLKNIEVPEGSQQYQLGYRDAVNTMRNILKRATQAYFVNNCRDEDEEDECETG